MKKQILLLAILTIVAFTANATIWTVSNNPNSPGQYSNLQDAIDAASAGDTIYVSGSETDYGTGTITKQLTIIGSGYNPNKNYDYNTLISYLELDTITSLSGASNSLIIGIEIGQFYGQQLTAINNIVVRRCKIGSISHMGNNWEIYNNIIGSLDGYSNPDDILISNNIIINGSCLSSFLALNNIVFTNNLFICNGGSIYINGYVNSIIFTNNIFYGIAAYSESNEYCTFNNNLTFLTSNNDIIITGNNSGSGNLIGTNPTFVDVPIEDFAFDYSYDFHLLDGSPCINAGTDGTDIGIYGGSYPFPSGGDVPWQTSAMPPIPQIIEMNIQNSVIPVDSTLHIQVKAKIQQ